ncbi:hypothetical protein BLA39750_00996 [Burkholderia lata]|uniref:Uncharacterized protein n=2 Tax=Burkholderia lata (strain ATCC 17760 / DSM 23089 / LMG 22485 / NCIMB 9086 / R18194 / 383) TaxID=482957 RepID=A0A6P2V9S8_BURL3|nr:hypothetical protein BLA39750_00996 [Burkholderia lata]
MKKVGGEIADDDPRYEEERFISTEVRPGYPSMSEGMEEGATYEFEEGNWYRVADRWWSFVDWVVKLSNLVGLNGELPAQGSDVAFRDIFRYGPHMGTFGTVASRRLAADFALWEHWARASNDEDFYDTYCLMRKMFEHAAEGGACWLRCH